MGELIVGTLIHNIILNNYTYNFTKSQSTVFLCIEIIVMVNRLRRLAIAIDRHCQISPINIINLVEHRKLKVYFE